MSSNSTRLWVVATPLGNPGDLSPRAREVLTQADFVLAEDTRRAGLLAARCGLNIARFISLHDHNETERLPAVLAELRGGATAALISDAGTPLLSDPGYRLVAACRAEGLEVSPVPGPSAPVAALSASGLPPQPFVFLGFPPRGKQAQRDFFGPYARLAATLIFFERKDRLESTLQNAAGVLGPRDGCIARELTKTYEQFIFFRLGAALPSFELLGEITVVLGPPGEDSATPEDDVRRLARQRREQTGGTEKLKESARVLQSQVVGWSVKDIYRLLQDND